MHVLGASGPKETRRWFSRSWGPQYWRSDYAPIPLSESEADDEMPDLWDYAQPCPPPISITDDDCDKDQDPLLSPCTARLERISLGANGDARGSIEAKKKEAPVKRIVKRARHARKERVPG